MENIYIRYQKSKMRKQKNVYNFSDITYFCNTKLEETNYIFSSKAEKRILIDRVISEYIKEQIKTIVITNVYEETNDVNKLITRLGYVMGKASVNIEYADFTHYIIACISDLQGWNIDWYLEEDASFISNPKIRKESNIIIYLKTHRETDPIQLLNFVYTEFLNMDLGQKEYKKQISSS